MKRINKNTKFTMFVTSCNFLLTDCNSFSLGCTEEWTTVVSEEVLASLKWLTVNPTYGSINATHAPPPPHTHTVSHKPPIKLPLSAHLTDSHASRRDDVINARMMEEEGGGGDDVESRRTFELKLDRPPSFKQHQQWRTAVAVKRVGLPAANHLDFFLFSTISAGL